MNLTKNTLLTRPESSYKNKSKNNTFNYSIRNNSFLSFNYSKKGDLIDDFCLVHELKGKLSSTCYVNKQEMLIF